MTFFARPATLDFYHDGFAAFCYRFFALCENPASCPTVCPVEPMAFSKRPPKPVAKRSKTVVEDIRGSKAAEIRRVAFRDGRFPMHDASTNSLISTFARLCSGFWCPCCRDFLAAPVCYESGGSVACRGADHHRDHCIDQSILQVSGRGGGRKTLSSACAVHDPTMHERENLLLDDRIMPRTRYFEHLAIVTYAAKAGSASIAVKATLAPQASKTDVTRPSASRGSA